MARQSSPNRITRLLIREKTRPAHPLQPRFREKTRPASVKTPNLSCFERAGRAFSRFHDDTATQGELFRARRRRPASATPQPPTQRAPRGLAAVPVGGGRAWPGFEATRRSATRPHWCGGRRKILPQCRWAVAGPGRSSRRRAERSSRRGRLAGGPPPTGTHSGRGLRRPEHPWGHKHHHNETRP